MCPHSTEFVKGKTMSSSNNIFVLALTPETPGAPLEGLPVDQEERPVRSLCLLDRRLSITDALQGIADLIKDDRIVDGRGDFEFLAVGDLAHGPA